MFLSHWLFINLFQSTLPRGERPHTSPCSTAPRDFNPRSHEGSDVSPLIKERGKYDFNPRSHEGSDLLRRRKSLGRRNFNPRSHEGSDVQIRIFSNCVSISIHAPTRGATAVVNTHAQFDSEFQSTLPRGERLILTRMMFSILHFNPRSHEGSDEQFSAFRGIVSIISIHAPTRGATRIDLIIIFRSSHFNPRSHEGSDRNARTAKNS